MEDDWFYSGPDGKLGPVNIKQLRKVLIAHPNGEDIYIWKDGLPDWVRAGDVPMLIPMAIRFVPKGPVEMAGLLQPNRAAVLEIEDKRAVSKFGPLIAAAVICCGLGLFYLGATGKITWVGEAFGLSDPVEASPSTVPVTGAIR
jgi:GYF domain 2